MNNLKVKFSKREAEILRLMEDGYRNREIAEKLDISQKTISTYVLRAKMKLKLSPEANSYILVHKALPHLEYHFGKRIKSDSVYEITSWENKKNDTKK